jgi:hypothetical protein
VSVKPTHLPAVFAVLFVQIVAGAATRLWWISVCGRPALRYALLPTNRAA